MGVSAAALCMCSGGRTLPLCSVSMTALNARRCGICRYPQQDLLLAFICIAVWRSRRSRATARNTSRTAATVRSEVQQCVAIVLPLCSQEEDQESEGSMESEQDDVSAASALSGSQKKRRFLE